MRRQLDRIRLNLVSELRAVASAYKNEFEVAKQQEGEAEKQLTTAVAGIPNDAQVTLRGLEASSESYRTFYDNYLQRHTAAVQEETSPVSEMRVVSRATYAPKTSPVTLRVLIMSLLGGLGAGVGIGMLSESTDRKFRTSEQIESELGKHCIAMVPLLKRQDLRLLPPTPMDDMNFWVKTDGAVHSIVGAQGRCITPNHLAYQMIVSNPFSRFTETIRSIKLTADLHSKKRVAKVIGLTSAIPGEGKTTIATSLATLTSRVGARTVLLDCDLRKPTLSKLLAPHAAVGLNRGRARNAGA